MAGSTWVTPEQAEFLTSWLSRYQEHSQDKLYHRFWAELYAEWFARWPEKGICLPGVTEGELTSEQNTVLAAAVTKRKEKLQTWFRWRNNNSRKNRLKNKKVSVFEKAIVPKASRLHTPTELYMLEHYDDRIKPQLIAKQEAGNIPEVRNNLSIVRKFAQDLLDSEEDEIKEKIQLMYKLQEKKSKPTCDDKPEVETNPEGIKRAIDDLPYALARVASLIKQHTGFATHFICAGPDPSRNWEISSISCHPDVTAEGKTFATLFPKECHASVKKFQEYAEMLFPPGSRDPTKSTSKGNCDEPGVERSLGDSPHGGCNAGDGDVAIGDSMDTTQNSQHMEDAGSKAKGQDGGGAEDDGSDGDAEGEEIEMGGEGVEQSQVSGIGASFGTWDLSGTADLSLGNPSATCFNASMQAVPPMIGFQTNFGNGSGGSQAIGDIPPLMGLQSFPAFPAFPSFNPGDSHVLGPDGFSHAGESTNGIPFSTAMRDITADLGQNWDFSGIGLDAFGTLPLSDLCSSQFGQTIAGSDADHLILPPVPNNPSPVRPRLPAVPPPSPLNHQETSSQEMRAMPCPQPKAKKQQARPRPTVKQKAAAHPVLMDHQAAGGPQMPDSAHSTSGCAANPSVPTGTTNSQQMGSTTATQTLQEIPTTKQPQVSVPSETRSSKRVPVQSKRNATADAIGTNQPSFVNGSCQTNGDQQELPTSPKKGKRSGECAEGAKKK